MTVRSIAPVLAPKHAAGVSATLSAKTPGWVTVSCKVAEQPFASVTVTLYMPAATFCKSCVVAWLFHKYV